MVRTIKQDWALCGAGSGFLGSAIVVRTGADEQDGMKQDKMQDDK